MLDLVEGVFEHGPDLDDFLDGRAEVLQVELRVDLLGGVFEVELFQVHFIDFDLDLLDVFEAEMQVDWV